MLSLGEVCITRLRICLRDIEKNVYLGILGCDEVQFFLSSFGRDIQHAVAESMKAASRSLGYAILVLLDVWLLRFSGLRLRGRHFGELRVSLQAQVWTTRG